MLAVSDIVKHSTSGRVPVPPQRYGNPLLQELLGADDLSSVNRRPLSTKGVITKQEWDAAINEWAAAPDLAGIPG